MVHESSAIKDEWIKFFSNEGESHYYGPSPGIIVHVKSFIRAGNRHLLVISPGLGESSLKYVELAREFLQKKFDVIAIDHRGQGFSSRMSKNPLIGHIDKFENYAWDLISIVEDFKAKKKYHSCLLVGQGMGAIVGLKGVLTSKELFNGAILSSPTFRFRMKKIASIFGLPLLKIANLLGLGQSPLLSKKFTEEETTCQMRSSAHQYFENLFPQTRLKGPSVRWFCEASDSSRKVMKRARELKIPILLMQAGKDHLTCLKHQNHFVQVLQNGRMVRLKESRHQIFQEVDPIRTRAMVQVTNFLEKVQE